MTHAATTHGAILLLLEPLVRLELHSGDRHNETALCLARTWPFPVDHYGGRFGTQDFGEPFMEPPLRTPRRSPPGRCSLCGKSKDRNELVAGEALREPIVAEILEEYPNWTTNQRVCFSCLNHFRAEHVRRLLEEDKGELSTLEEEVVRSFQEQEAISENINEEFDRDLTFGQRLADRVAEFGGSWTFIVLFGAVLVGWIVVNSIVLATRPFDPYPFILLNLILSCLAAIQAPIIMMSQNRQEAKDRLRAEHDYVVNLKAELEVRLLHTKMDQLLTHQWHRLLEIQELQVELMESVADRQKGSDAC